jgi:hypothetical protein
MRRIHLLEVFHDETGKRWNVLSDPCDDQLRKQSTEMAVN